jgi:hypothetical protein
MRLSGHGEFLRIVHCRVFFTRSLLCAPSALGPVYHGNWERCLGQLPRVACGLRRQRDYGGFVSPLHGD